MNRRSFLGSFLTFAAAAAAVVVPTGSAEAKPIRVRYGVARWIRRHRRYLHHHLPRRRFR